MPRTFKQNTGGKLEVVVEIIITLTRQFSFVILLPFACKWQLFLGYCISSSNHFPCGIVVQVELS